MKNPNDVVLRANRRGMFDSRAAFTLVELLVVVAIISTLAALLMPAVSSALGQARASVCQNNLKQLGLCVSAYEGDFGDYIPYAGVCPSIYRDPVYGWMAMYLPPYALGRPSYVGVAGTGPYAHIYKSVDTVAMCPVNPRPWNRQHGVNCAWQNGNYGLNYRIAYTYINYTDWSKRRRVTSLKGSVSAKLFATDLADDGAYWGGNGWSAGWSIGPAYVSHIDGRHGQNRANVLYMDLHAGSLDPSGVSSTDTALWEP